MISVRLTAILFNVSYGIAIWWRSNVEFYAYKPYMHWQLLEKVCFHFHLSLFQRSVKLAIFGGEDMEAMDNFYKSAPKRITPLLFFLNFLQRIPRKRDPEKKGWGIQHAVVCRVGLREGRVREKKTGVFSKRVVRWLTSHFLLVHTGISIKAPSTTPFII